MPNAIINNTTIHYLDKGDGHAGTLLLLHGFPLSSQMWTPQIDALSGHWRVIAPDFRGFGQSAETGPFSIEQLADDVHELIKQLGLSKIVLAGLSMGGYVALAYVRKYAATLRGLILLDTKAEPDNPEGKINRDRMIAIVKERGAKPIADIMLPKLVPQEILQHRPQIARALRQMMESTRPATIAEALAAMRDRPDRSSELAEITTPTLAIVGDQDVITPPDVMNAMQENIPHSQLKIITASGHMANLEQPSQVNAAIEHFLISLSTSN
jgi:3-oxoadipate enol-lactonase